MVINFVSSAFFLFAFLFRNFFPYKIRIRRLHTTPRMRPTCKPSVSAPSSSYKMAAPLFVGTKGLDGNPYVPPVGLLRPATGALAFPPLSWRLRYFSLPLSLSLSLSLLTVVSSSSFFFLLFAFGGGRHEAVGRYNRPIKQGACLFPVERACGVGVKKT